MKSSVPGKKQWDAGMIFEQLDERSYLVECESGTLRRNRHHFMKTNENYNQHTTQESKKPVVFNNSGNSLELDASDYSVRPTAKHNTLEGPHTDITDKGRNTIILDNGRKVRTTQNKMPERFRDYAVSR